MRSISSGIALSLCLLVANAAVAAPPQQLGVAPMPSVLFFWDKATLPIWVEASAAVDEAGRVRSYLFGEEAAGIQRQLDKLAAADCLRFEKVHQDHVYPPRRENLDDAAEDSRTRLLARVTNKAFGFSGAVPGQLLQVVPIRAFTEALPERHYYFFVPAGKFRLDKRLICQEDPDYAEPPEVGSEVFLFIAGAPVGTEGNLLFVYGPGDIVPVARDGSLSLPRQYRSAAAAAKSATPRSKAELIDRLDRAFPQKVWR